MRRRRSEIDRLLAEHQGERRAPKADAMGAVPVETTPAGIHALAESARAQAILDDQAISVLD